MTTRLLPKPPVEPSLYEELGEPIPTSVATGETRITAAKETIDNDTEDVSDDDLVSL